MLAVCVRGSPTPPLSTRPWRLCFRVTVLRWWTLATPPTMLIRPTSPTNGVTLRRGGGRQRRRDGVAGARGAVVVRDGRGRAASRRCAFPRRGDTPASPEPCRAVYHHDPWARQRGGSGPRSRSGPPAFGRQSGCGRKCLCRSTCQSAWPAGRRPDATNLRSSRGCGRLPPLTGRAPVGLPPQAGPLYAAQAGSALIWDVLRSLVSAQDG